MGIYVISSRPERGGAANKWSVLYSPNGTAPAATPVQPNYLPSALVNSIVDPLVIVVHGYNNREQDVFSAYAGLAGLVQGKESLPKYGFTGTIIGFDWPSGYLNVLDPSAQLRLYGSDLAAAYGNGAPCFGLFLNRLTTALIGKNIRVNLLAHSMGNFVATRALMDDPSVASRITNFISFAPDILQSDVDLPQLQSCVDNMAGKWCVNWAQADMILMTASNWANMFLGTERYHGDRLGQVGLRPNVDYGDKITAQECDQMLSDVGATSFDQTLGEWRSSTEVHCAYWRCPEFMKSVAAAVK
ncbi:MAG TPA: alpha/beta hydrolase [Verrucomicrobiae bacterium]|nr:alpha/beta hydrolase [Verrucomicrobiae bacterium]